jgi:large subunit ribosomal protein L24
MAASNKKLNVKKGDTVQVITGKDKRAKGRVISAHPDTERVLVEGVNRVKRHTKVTQTSRGAQSGGIVVQEAPVHVSNVMVVCPNCDKPSRIGHRRNDEGRSVRVCRRCGGDIA